MKNVEMVELIRTRLAVRGQGTAESLLRTVEQYWTRDGVLLFEIDPCPTGKAKTDEAGGAAERAPFMNRLARLAGIFDRWDDDTALRIFMTHRNDGDLTLGELRALVGAP